MALQGSQRNLRAHVVHLAGCCIVTGGHDAGSWLAGHHTSCGVCSSRMCATSSGPTSYLALPACATLPAAICSLAAVSSTSLCLYLCLAGAPSTTSWPPSSLPSPPPASRQAAHSPAQPAQPSGLQAPQLPRQCCCSLLLPCHSFCCCLTAAPAQPRMPRGLLPALLCLLANLHATRLSLPCFCPADWQPGEPCRHLQPDGPGGRDQRAGKRRCGMASAAALVRPCTWRL